MVNRLTLKLKQIKTYISNITMNDGCRLSSENISWILQYYNLLLLVVGNVERVFKNKYVFIWNTDSAMFSNLNWYLLSQNKND